jgi:signal recognition particle subunit SRP72
MSTPHPDLASLLRQTHLSSPEDILKTANAALRTSKSDATAQQTKIVALLKLDRFEDALRVFDEAGEALKGKAALEYAYALYKCGELEKAREVAEKHTTSDSRGIVHVAAQTVCTRVYEGAGMFRLN